MNVEQIFLFPLLGNLKILERVLCVAHSEYNMMMKGSESNTSSSPLKPTDEQVSLTIEFFPLSLLALVCLSIYVVFNERVQVSFALLMLNIVTSSVRRMREQRARENVAFDFGRHMRTKRAENLEKIFCGRRKIFTSVEISCE